MLREKKRKARRILAFLLSAVMLLSGIRTPAFGDTQYDDYLDGWKVQCVWANLSTDYEWNAAVSETKQPKIIAAYRLENANRDYPAGSLRFAVPGIGNASRASIKKASSLAAEQADSEWAYSWDQDLDTYIFTNKFEVKKGQSVSGGFELLWTLDARECTAGFSQERSPQFSVEDSGTIRLEPLSYEFSSERDRYRISMSRQKLNASDYENADSDYIWYDIETRFDKDWKARGLYRSDYYVTVELPEGKDYSDIRIRYDGKAADLTQDADGNWGFYPFRERSGDLGSQRSTYYNVFTIGFRKETLENSPVTVHGHLDRLYHDEADWETEAGENEKVDDELKFSVDDYSFSYTGYIYSHSKTGPYSNSYQYTQRLNAGNIYNGKILQFTLQGSANRNYAEYAPRNAVRARNATPSNAAISNASKSNTGTSNAAISNTGALNASASNAVPSTARVSNIGIKSDPTKPGGNTSGVSQIGETQEYSLVLGDDKLAVFLNDGSIRSLEDDEYDISYVTIPADSRKYEYEVYGAFSQDTHFDEYELLGTGNTDTTQTISFPDGIKAVFVRVNGITGSYTYDAYAGVRLQLDWEEEQKKTEAERVDHENRLVNFSYLRSLYEDAEGREVNDCALTVKNYSGSYGLELAERDLSTYGEQMVRSYSNVWLRSPVTGLRASADLAAFTGSGKDGFYSNVQAAGTIKADNDGSLEKFSLYAVLPDGIKADLDNGEITINGSGTKLGGQAAGDFADHASVYETTYNGKAAVAVDFDFSDSPLEISQSAYASIRFPVSLSYADYVSLGNQYTINTYLMVHDGGIDKISGSAIMADQYDIDRDGMITEKMAYASSTQTVLDNAAEWREYVSKYVKSAYSSGYVTDTVTRLYQENDGGEEKEKSRYSYRLDFGLGSSNAKNIIFFDHIEQGAVVAETGDGNDEQKNIASEWQGSFLSVDTSYAESMKMVPTIYYSVDPAQEFDLAAPGWSTDMPENSSEVKSIAVSLDTGNMDDGLMKTRQMTYVEINMQAPEDRALIGKAAVNQYEVQYDAYGLTSGFERTYRLPSSETYVKLLDTVGKMILQKVDADNAIRTEEDGTVHYASVTGAEFQVYDSSGQALFEEPKALNSIGRITISNVPHGIYYYEEIEAPAGYRRLEGRHAFEVDGVTETLEIENHRIRGTVILTKHDRDDKALGPLSGAVYELYNAAGNQIFTDASYAYAENGTNSSFETGDDGTFKVTNLPWGSYYFKEIAPPDGYDLNSGKVPFEIGKSQYDRDTDSIRVSVDAYDSESYASLLLKKTDAQSGRAVKDAVYSLYRKKESKEAKDLLISSGHKTNATGEIEVGGLKYGTYYFLETRNPGGYEMPEGDAAKTEAVTLDASTAGRTIKVFHTDERKEGSVNLIKSDDAGQLVGGAEYALWYKPDTAASDSEYSKVGVYTTGSAGDSKAAGEIFVEGLPWGSYYFVETRAPKGYELSKERIEFTVDKDSVQNTICLETTNIRRKGSVRLTKVDKANPEMGLEGAEYELYRTDGTKCILGQDYELPDGMTAIRTGTDGSVIISNIRQGGYYLVETAAPASYSLSTEYIRFSVTKENSGSIQELTAEDEKGKAVITINKEINEIYQPFGNPVFIFKISGGGKTYVKTIALSDGELSGSISLTVDQGNIYTITEQEISRYALENIIPVSNVIVEGNAARADLTVQTEAEVTFVNRMDQYEKFSHTSSIINLAKARAKLTGIRVEYTGPEIITKDLDGYDSVNDVYVFPKSDLIVTAFYDDGTSETVPEEDYILDPESADGTSESYTGTVSYTEDGVTGKDSFQTELRLPVPLPRYRAVFELNGGAIVPDGGSSAQDTLSTRVKAGQEINMPQNVPVKEGYEFDGWYTDAALTKEASFPVTITEDTTFYASWTLGLVNVKYAVSIYGIQQDTDENGNTVGLTFGPATGDCYVSTYKSHEPSEGQMCMHDMTWQEIIAQSAIDPAVFRECLENGCTHSVALTITGPLAKKAVSYPDMTGDGAGTLEKSINPSYRKWNRPNSKYFNEAKEDYQYGSATGGWKDSAVRNTLTGVLTKDMISINNKDNGFEEAKLDETTALISCFPAELRAAIVAKAVRSDRTHYDVLEKYDITYDRLWLFSGKETYVNRGYVNAVIRQNEGNLYDRASALGIYVNKNDANKAYNEESARCARWLRSPYRVNSHNVYYVLDTGSWKELYVRESLGLSPGFCIPGPLEEGS